MNLPILQRLSAAWGAFWFTPQSPRATTAVRAGVGLLAALWFASFLPVVEGWFGATGIMSRELTGKMIQFENTSAWQQWSPLWFVESTSLQIAWLVVGIVIAAVVASGLFGRVAVAVLLFWTIAWANRILWLQSPFEPALIAIVGSLLVNPGAPVWQYRQWEPRAWQWTAGMSLRLVQVHVWLFIAAGLLTQLAGLVWWRGEAAWWLASAGRSYLLTPATLSGQPMLVNAVTHGIVLLQVLALWLLVTRAARAVGIACGLLVALSIAFLADYVLYGLLLAACLAAFAFYRLPAVDQRAS